MSARIVSDEQKETQKQLETTCWILYCGCFGYGCASCGDPYCEGKSKCCCIAQEIKTTNFYNDTEGLCAGTNKAFCFLSNCIVPAPQPFIELFGYRLCGPAKPTNQVAGGGFGSGFTVETDESNSAAENLESEVQNALLRKDYDEAIKLISILRTHRQNEEHVVALPAAITMSGF